MSDNRMLVTSITRRDIENQQRAIAGWSRLGFSVCSLNARADIEDLKPLFDTVEFVEAPAAGRPYQGGSLVSFDDVVALLVERGSPVCGLIRSDVHLRATPEALRFVMQEAKGSLLFASRTDVGSFADATGEVRKSGFDAFFFDPDALRTLPATGLPFDGFWWDLWLPYCHMSSAGGLPLKFVSFPFAVHVTSAEGSAMDDAYAKGGMAFAEFLDPGAHAALLGQPPELLKGSLDALKLNVAMAILFESRWLSCFPG